MIDFSDFLNALGDDDFEEKPVDIETFIHDPTFMNIEEVSEYQLLMLKSMTQIYKKSTLVNLYGEEEGERRWKETYKEVILQLGKGCHAPYTPTFDPETGLWPSLDSSSGDGMVISHDGKAHYATESFLEGFGEMVRVRTSLGFSEDVYVGHGFLGYGRSRFYHRYRGHRPEKMVAGELLPGDRIAVAVGFDVSSPVDIDPVHAELAGYWLGDGMLPADHNPIINMDFGSGESESIARYLELCDIIGDAPTRTDHAEKKMISFRHGRNSKAVVIARDLGLWGMRSKTKRIPEKIMASSNNVLVKTIEKLWQTDGCVYSKNGLTAEFCSVSPQLALDVQRSLLRIGVPAGIRSRTPKSNFNNASEAHYVTVSSQECFNAFQEKIVLLDHKASASMNKPGRVYRRLEEGVYYDRVVSVERIGKAEYWTRTVPDTGTYVGSGPISFNSGKDFSSTIACAYIVYLLLCLRDPARYYGKPPGDAIDIINIAINAQQAKNVFFKGFKERITRSPWFQGKYTPTADAIRFDKSVTVHSGHSEREAWEGYNVLVVILDEISGFALDSTSGNSQAKTAEEVYKMYAASVASRFPDYGKLLLLSFPRFRNDFIQQRYNKVIGEKHTVLREETLIIHPDLPKNDPDNQVKISWEEDHIIKYKVPRVFALKRPTWEVNPQRSLEELTGAFVDDYLDSLSRFACMPPDAVDAFFRSREKMEQAFRNPRWGIDDAGRFTEHLKPVDDRVYYVHVDLAQKVDRCVVSMAHVEDWVKIDIGHYKREAQPRVVVDAIRWWTPSKAKTVDFSDVREFILDLYRMGFNIGLVTFDRWNSHQMMDELKQYGIRTDVLSVAKKHYQDLALAIVEERVEGPDNKILIDELLALRVVKDKIDHPRTGTKDLADATCGAIYNAVAHTPKNLNREIEIHTYTPDDVRSKSVAEPKSIDPTEERPPDAPKIPMDLSDYLDRISAL
jgi:intein/homing endonuclease